MVSEQYVIDFVRHHADLFSRVKPSFFEMTVAMAFKYFADSQVDIAVIEVGLGGRLDSTNIITPLASVITNISFDHMALLGNTLEKIASEKAGIINPVFRLSSVRATKPTILFSSKKLKPVKLRSNLQVTTGRQRLTSTEVSS